MFPFVNYCILENSTAVASKCLFTQNFWYSVIQLINGKEPTNSTKFPNRLLSSFHKINIKHSSILRPIELRLEVSQCISEACYFLHYCDCWKFWTETYLFLVYNFMSHRQGWLSLSGISVLLPPAMLFTQRFCSINIYIMHNYAYVQLYLYYYNFL